jgi:hypothetical protein
MCRPASPVLWECVKLKIVECRCKAPIGLGHCKIDIPCNEIEGGREAVVIRSLRSILPLGR